MPEKINSNITSQIPDACESGTCVSPTSSNSKCCSSSKDATWSAEKGSCTSSTGSTASDNDVICTCMNVTLGEIKSAIANGAKNVEDIKNKTGAGTGCGSCVGTLQDILDGKIK